MDDTISSVRFVCSQNICRSTAAEIVFRYLSDKTGLPVNIDSAGLSARDGDPPDRNVLEVAIQRGYKVDNLISRRLTDDDLKPGTLLVAADTYTATTLESLLKKMPELQSGAQPDDTGKTPPPARVVLLTQFAETFSTEFENHRDLQAAGSIREAQMLFDRVEDTCLGLLDVVKASVGATPAQ